MGALDGLKATVKSILTTFGQAVTYRTFTEAYDPVIGANTRTATDATVRALVEDYPARDLAGGSRDVGGVVAGDRKVTIAANALSAAPTTEAQVLIGSVTYSIVKIDTQTGTDDALMYTLQVRR